MVLLRHPSLAANVAPLFCIHTSKPPHQLAAVTLAWAKTTPATETPGRHHTSIVIQSPRFILEFPNSSLLLLTTHCGATVASDTGSILLFSPSGIFNLASRIYNPQIHPHSEHYSETHILDYNIQPIIILAAPLSSILTELMSLIIITFLRKCSSLWSLFIVLVVRYLLLTTASN